MLRLKHTGLLLLALFVARFALAGDTGMDLLLDLGSTNRTVRTQALERIAHSGDQRMVQVLSDYRLASLYLYHGRIVLGLETGTNKDFDEYVVLGDVFTHQPLLNADGSPVTALTSDIKCLEPSRRERMAVLEAITLLELGAPDTDTRLDAVRRTGLGDSSPSILSRLDEMSGTDPKRIIRHAAKASAALLRLRQGDPSEQENAIAELGRLRSIRARSFIEDLNRPDDPVVKKALGRIRTMEHWVQAFNILNSGISSGSVLVLMALGLAVTFGMMGIINMAHGEMMMIGAYTTYCMQQLFRHSPETPHNMFFVVALPMAFLVSALFGGLIEWTVVRRLYKRPLESLLATYGVGLILIQVIRLIFGDNRSCNSPTWLVGGVELSDGMSLSYNRIFIFILCALCVVGVVSLMRRTSLGLKMRAVIQNRDMAAAMGINTRRTDSFTFMLGSGLAGIAGAALTTIGGITPDMGQNYIVDSFLVVVTGGVGNLAGVVCSGMGLGLLNKILEGTFFGAVWAKIIVLVAVIAFIQYKPSGLFAAKGRLADD